MKGIYGNPNAGWTREDHERDVEQAFAWLRGVMWRASERASASSGGCECGRRCGSAFALPCPTLWPASPDVAGHHVGADAAISSDQRKHALVKKLAAMVVAHEGDYDSVNKNTDGAGASIGIFQWPQRSGDLGRLLKGYYRADAQRFIRIFGPQYRELLQATSSASMEPVGGTVLWVEPWVSRFRAAGREPVFQAVQDRMAMDGVHMRKTFEVTNILGFMTERSLAMVLDAVVSQGPNAAEKVAWKVRKLYGGRVAPMKEVLEAYLEMAVSHLRRTTAPTSPPKAAHLAWRKVGNEWHIYAGQVNLYRNIMGRRGPLLSHPELSDELLRFEEAVS